MFIAIYDSDGKFYEFLSNVNSTKSFSFKENLKRGSYFIWCYVNYEASKIDDPNFNYVINIRSIDKNFKM